MDGDAKTNGAGRRRRKRALLPMRIRPELLARLDAVTAACPQSRDPLIRSLPTRTAVAETALELGLEELTHRIEHGGEDY